MFSPEQLTYLVIPDGHGEREKVARAVDFHEPNIDMFVFLGDVIDGPDSFGVIRLIRELGDRAITIAGNHEWVCRNALSSSDLAVNGYKATDAWRNQTWPRYEKRMLASYGIKRTTDWRANAHLLRQVMNEYGDLNWLESLPPYFETKDFVAVHSGPKPSSPWTDQADCLDYAASCTARLTNEPEQLFNHKLAVVADLPESVDSRTFVTGHLPLSLPAEKRTAQRRVCLASHVNYGAPLFVWNSSDNTIYQH